MRSIIRTTLSKKDVKRLQKKKESLEKEMSQMAADPDIRCALTDISEEFTCTQHDGLREMPDHRMADVENALRMTLMI